MTGNSECTGDTDGLFALIFLTQIKNTGLNPCSTLVVAATYSFVFNVAYIKNVWTA